MGGQLGGPFVKHVAQGCWLAILVRGTCLFKQMALEQPRLRSWVIAGAAVSCLAQQLSEMAEASFQLQGASLLWRMMHGCVPKCLFMEQVVCGHPW